VSDAAGAPPGLRAVLARIGTHAARLEAAPRSVRAGRLVRMNGLMFEVEGLPLELGQRACVQATDGRFIESECIGFHGRHTFLMAIDPLHGVAPGAPVHPSGTPAIASGRFVPVTASPSLPVGEALLGRVVDGCGRPLDGLPVGDDAPAAGRAVPLNPLQRTPIHVPMEAGVRAIDGLLTLGRGQRIGIFAGSGVGKSVLLGMLARRCVADVIVVALVGERGREVREFCEDTLGEAGRARSVVVAAPADASPLARLRGAWYATDVACWFRDRGRHVVLIVDSLSRFAMAQRELALGLGEPPVSRGYPPSVFARLPELVERAGNGPREDGSITAFYTVLLEGDDHTDPVADTARGILDGHLFLSRELADAGHYPAIDVERSISRVMPRVASPEHLRAARRVKQLVSRYARGRDLVGMGAYSPGSDPELDAALRAWPDIEAFLCQDATESTAFDDAVRLLDAIARRHAP
jgi:flagellum-specific ATP synthase